MAFDRLARKMATGGTRAPGSGGVVGIRVGGLRGGTRFGGGRRTTDRNRMSGRSGGTRFNPRPPRGNTGGTGYR